jgi:hypothetical protein
MNTLTLVELYAEYGTAGMIGVLIALTLGGATFGALIASTCSAIGARSLPK